MAWVYLATAIVLEVAGTSAMKASDGFRRAGPSALMLICYLASLAVLNLSLRQIPVSVAYAVWSGLGTALVTAVGYGWFQEPLGPGKIGGISLIVAGVVWLNLSGAGH